MTTTADAVVSKLQGYEARKEGADKWRANSPLRPGANSHSFTLTIQDSEHGAYYDHVSGESGSLYQLAEALGIEPNRTAISTTKRTYESLDDYARAHGVTAEIMRAAGWKDCEQVYDAAAKRKRPALPFETASGTRYRFIDGDKAQATYKAAQTGYKNCWYGLRRAVDLAKQHGTPLVLCNGEASTVTAQHYGIAAACVTGGEKKYPNELVQQLLSAWDGDIWIALDCDDTGRRAAREIAEQLASRAPVVIDLGLTAGGDMGDFCTLYGTEARAALAARAIPMPKDNTPPMSDVQALANALDGLKSALRADAVAKAKADVETLLAGAQGEIDRIAAHIARPTLVSFEDVIARNLADLDFARSAPNAIRGLRTKIGALDKALGGLTPEMYTIYGATSMGKSTLCVSIARELVQQAPGLIVPTESSPHRWMTKLVASLTLIPSDLIETGQISESDYRRVKDTYDWLAILNCHFIANTSPTVSMIRPMLLDGLGKYGYKWIIGDSASRMSHPGATSIYDITRGVANGLQDLWKEADVPMIITSQLGRDVAERPVGQKQPRLEDGYGGGVIEQNAGVVLGLYNHNYYVARGVEPADPDLPENTALVRILKNRWGGGSQISVIKLKFVPGAGFYQLDTRTQEGR